MYRVLHLIVLIAYFLLPIHVSAGGKQDPDYALPVRANELKIMNYNVQNLFDAEHDDNKQDFEFLPKSDPEKANCDRAGRSAKVCRKLDWTDEKVDLKISQIVEAIGEQGTLPDILVLEEVENEAVVSRLGTALGYDAFRMTNSPDVRGIDVAILFKKSKLTYLNYYEREVKDAMRPTRNLSAMVFQLDRKLGGGILAVFGNHWPSQGSPTQARLIVANNLRNFVDSLRAAYSKYASFQFVIAGDFNTIDSDSPHPINTVLLDKRWSEKLVDVHQWAIDLNAPMISKMPPGTYYYGVESQWNELDHFFVSAELTDGEGLEADPYSYRINAPSLVSKEEKGMRVPFRYNHNTSDPRYVGYSDHFAIVFKLKYGK